MAENVRTVEFVRCRKLCVVDPPVREVWPDETVVFANTTRAELRIFFGKSELFGTERLSVAGGAQERLQVKARKPEKPTVYHYSVFCDETDNFGVGGSNPRIILNP